MAQPIVMPSMGMYTEEGVLSAWLRAVGTRVEMGEPILEITTEKVTFEVQAPAAGILHQAAEVGASLHVEALLGYILADGEAPPAGNGSRAPQLPARSAVPHSAPIVPTARQANAPVKATPAARRLASQHGVDLTAIDGSGPGGRIVEADVLAILSQQPERKAPL